MSDKNETMMMMSCSMGEDMNINTDAVNAVFNTANSGNLSNGTGGGNVNLLYQTNDGCGAFYDITPWHYWRDHYYPNVIRESYPIYIRERAEDKGKQAFEIVKVLKDKKLIKFTKVGDFIDLMDELIKIL